MYLLSEKGRETLLTNRMRVEGDAGAAWVNGLAALIERVAGAWCLSLEPHFDNLSYNYVAPVRTHDGVPAVLKLSPPHHDFLCEAEAMRAFDGHACARRLRVDLEAGAMLLERLEPGVEVHTLEDDVAETSAVAAVMRDLQRPYGGIFVFPRATDWLADALAPEAIPSLKARYPWIERALDRITTIEPLPDADLLLHGDLHHDNVLSGRGGEWLAIDPHGVIGDPAWEIAPFLFNRLERHPRADWPRIIRRRTDQLAEELSLDRERVYAWSAVRCVQSAFWSLRDEEDQDGPIHEGAKVCGEVLASARP